MREVAKERERNPKSKIKRESVWVWTECVGIGNGEKNKDGWYYGKEGAGQSESTVRPGNTKYCGNMVKLN